MAANFDLSALAIKAVCPNNEIIYDNLGMPSIMVKIPKMTYAQLGMGTSTAVHPAFIVNDKEIDAIYISKYQNTVRDNRAYSLPGVEPRTNITFDEAQRACEAKGEGWHLMTRMEWGMIVRWCQQNGVLPLGNNSYGKHQNETVYKAVPATKADGKINKTAAGTGPLTWYHDQTPSGIADLCGNVWEWTGGIRTVYGEIQILENNNGADAANSQGENSTEWRAIRATDGELITPDETIPGMTLNSVKMNYNIGKTLTYCTTEDTSATVGDSGIGPVVKFSEIQCSSELGDRAKLVLQSLGMLMYGADDLFASQRVFWTNSSKERMVCSGAAWNGTGFGIASFGADYKRNGGLKGTGFRAVYCEL